MELNLENIINAIKSGSKIDKDVICSCTPRGGCGRAYVCFAGKDRKELGLFKKAFKTVGYRYIGKAYGSGSKSVYIGYDNGTGVELLIAEQIANNLLKLGLDVYFDGVAD